MVSPLTNRSISAPDINALTSNTSSRSSNSAKGISWTKKAGSLIITRKPKSELTEESLEEFNKRNALLEEKRYGASSPYYKGLTDFTLDIQKVDKLPVTEINDAGSVASSSRSSFVTTIQHLGTFCMFLKASDDEKESSSNSTSLSSKTHKDVDLEEELVQNKESNSSTLRTILLNNKEKSLRERVLSQAYSPPAPQQMTQPPYQPPPPLPSDANKVTSPQPILHAPSPPPTPPPQLSEAAQVTSPQPISYLPPTPTEESTEVEKNSVQQQTIYLSPTLTSPLGGPSEIEKDGVPQLISQQRYSSQQAEPVITATNDDAIIKEDIISDGEEERVMLFTWADEYRPKALKKFICNREKALKLQTMANATDCCHFIFEGPPGMGKRTMISAFLRETFGAEQVKVNEERKEFHFKGEAVSSISVNLKRSSRHVEVNLSDLKGYEKHVIVDLMKDKVNRKTNNELRCKTDDCRAIILYEADKLSQDALLYIRWLLERYKGNNKVFFCCNEASKLQPIKSLCKVVNLLPPSNKEIVEVLEFIAKKEGIELSHQLAENIASNSTNNLRQAIRSFEATWRTNNCNPQLNEDQEIMTGWEEAIAKVARDIVKEQSPRQLFRIRTELQQLIEHNVSPVFIFKTLVGELKKHLSDSSQLHIDQLYKDFSKDSEGDEPLAFGRNRTEEMSKRHNDPNRKKFHQFMRIEEFIAKFMSWYKSLDAASKL